MLPSDKTALMKPCSDMSSAAKTRMEISKSTFMSKDGAKEEEATFRISSN
jgi:hypothetical protein